MARSSAIGQDSGAMPSIVAHLFHRDAGSALRRACRPTVKAEGRDVNESDFDAQGSRCPNCGSRRMTQFQATASDSASPDIVNITECDSCGFAWQYPLARSSEQSVQYFEAAYLDAGRSQSDYFDPDNKRQIAELELEFVESLVPAKGTILDIGAGAGIFAEVAARHGWLATALDPALEITNPRPNGPVRFIKGTTSDVPEGTTFDVVTMWDVIEHVTNPLETLKAATRLVSSDGWLILETGNYRSADRVQGGLDYWIYQLDHRWYFSPDSLANLLRSVGYTNVVFAKRAHRPNWNGSPQYPGLSPRALLKEILRRPFRMKGHVTKYLKLMEAREWAMSGIPIFTVAAKKA